MTKDIVAAAHAIARGGRKFMIPLGSRWPKKPPQSTKSTYKAPKFSTTCIVCRKNFFTGVHAIGKRITCPDGHNFSTTGWRD